MATFNGTTGNDILYGSSNGDNLYGYEGNDTLYGGMGDDWLIDVSGTNYLDGGDGTDSVSYSTAITLDLFAGTATGTNTNDTLVSIENVSGSGYNDTLYGSSEVVAMRPSESRPRAGILTVRTDGFNQDELKVCTFTRSVLLPTRPEKVND